MMESGLLQPSWSWTNNYNTSSSSLDDSGLYSFAMDDPCDFSSSFLSGDSISSSGISFDSYFAGVTASPPHPHSLLEFPSFSDEKQVMETIADMWMEESDSDGNVSSQLTCESDPWTPPQTPPVEQTKPCLTQTIPGAGGNTYATMEMDEDDHHLHQVWLNHLLRAYGEAVQNGHQELTEVIARRISEKIDPLGEPLERVAFNLFQSRETLGQGQGNYHYLRQQSAKNREEAFEAFYQWYPYGRFAHFTANSAILQAMPTGTAAVDTIHIVDFDMGEGIQWPPLIEALSRERKSSALRITSVKSSDEEDPQWNFEDTKRRLCHHAASLGLDLRVEEMELEDLVSEITRMKKRGGAREWLAFNLMVELPHMARQRDRSQVAEFLRVAKDLLAYSDGNRGIITFGDGEACSTTYPEYSSFFHKRVKHFQALFDSVECDFPVYLPEARIAMESLFISPYVSSRSWFQQWKGAAATATATAGLEGWRMSRESLMEAKQMVSQRERGSSSYKVFFIQGRDNEMVLEWKGIPLVRISCWTIT